MSHLPWQISALSSVHCFLGTQALHQGHLLLVCCEPSVSVRGWLGPNEGEGTLRKSGSGLGPAYQPHTLRILVWPLRLASCPLHAELLGEKAASLDLKLWAVLEEACLPHKSSKVLSPRGGGPGED